MSKKTFWILILIGVILLLFFVVASNIISVGERVRQIHVYAEYAFYGIAFILLFVLVIRPLYIIFLSPTFAINVLDDETKNAKVYRNAAKNLLRMDTLLEADKKLLRENLNSKELPMTLKSIYHGTIRKQLDDIVVKHSKTVVMTTAISQNGNLDMFSVIITNIRMIKAMVEACGFRPSYTNLAKLGLNVTITAMIAEGLEDINFSEILPSKFGEAMSDIPILRTATNSIFQGISNGLLTCRIGIVTRKYLFKDNTMMTQRELRLSSYKESFKLMPVVIAGGLAQFPKGIINMALKPFRNNPFSKKAA